MIVWGGLDRDYQELLQTRLAKRKHCLTIEDYILRLDLCRLAQKIFSAESQCNSPAREFREGLIQNRWLVQYRSLQSLLVDCCHQVRSLKRDNTVICYACVAQG